MAPFRIALVLSLLVALGGCAIVRLPIKAAGAVVGAGVDIVTRTDHRPY